MKRWDMLKLLVNTGQFKSYLEIGIKHGRNYGYIKCPDKTGVDPSPLWKDKTIHCVTSDDFFKTNKKTFDLVFIDGWHEHKQVLRDIDNALKVLNPGGFILMHDCSPRSFDRQKAPVPFNGDCWKALVEARTIYTHEIFTVNTDEGVGVINTRNTVDKKLIVNKKLTYDNLDRNRNDWLNLKSISYYEDYVSKI